MCYVELIAHLLLEYEVFKTLLPILSTIENQAGRLFASAFYSNMSADTDGTLGVRSGEICEERTS